MRDVAYAQSTDYAMVRSSVTGHSIVVNRSATQFLVPPAFDATNVAPAVQSFLAERAEKKWRDSWLLSPEILQVASTELCAARTIEQFVHAINALITHSCDYERGPPRKDGCQESSPRARPLWHLVGCGVSGVPASAALVGWANTLQRSPC
jgi:hypothetical protein